MKPMLKKLAAGAVLSAFAAGAAAQTPLERRIKSRGYEFPNVLNYGDFYKAALDEGMVEVEKMLAEHGVAIVGEGGGRYVRMRDLLRACGEKCSYDEGWGIFLGQFAVMVHRK